MIVAGIELPRGVNHTDGYLWAECGPVGEFRSCRWCVPLAEEPTAAEVRAALVELKRRDPRREAGKS